MIPKHIEPGSEESCIRLQPLAQAISDMPATDFWLMMFHITKHPEDAPKFEAALIEKGKPNAN